MKKVFVFVSLILCSGLLTACGGSGINSKGSSLTSAAASTDSKAHATDTDGWVDNKTYGLRTLSGQSPATGYVISETLVFEYFKRSNGVKSNFQIHILQNTEGEIVIGGCPNGVSLTAGGRCFSDTPSFSILTGVRGQVKPEDSNQIAVMQSQDGKTPFLALNLQVNSVNADNKPYQSRHTFVLIPGGASGVVSAFHCECGEKADVFTCFGNETRTKLDVRQKQVQPR